VGRSTGIANNASYRGWRGRKQPSQGLQKVTPQLRVRRSKSRLAGESGS
jgi:hypothetical protein